MTPRIMLIDGHALAFRAFYALADKGLRTSTGEPTYAVFGFASILLNAIKEHQPTHIAVSFDIGRTFRDDLYSEYKAGRSETPVEFHPQLDRIKELMQAFSIPIYVAAGFEADDVLGTLARQATAANVDTIILTGDSDTLQLVDDHVHVLLANPFGQRMTSIEYDEAKVIERYDGLRPNQLADLRGLKGDASDNIPGVKGIGEKGAIALLNQFTTIEGMYANFADVPNRYKKILTDQYEAALFSKRLATIVTDAPVSLNLVECDINDYDKSSVIRFLQSLEIGQSLVARLPASGRNPVHALPSNAPAPPARPTPVAQSAQLDMFGENGAQSGVPETSPALRHGYRTVTTHAQLQALHERIKAVGAVAFDTETTGTSVFQDECVGVSLACAPHEAWYIPLRHHGVETLPRHDILAVLGDIFHDTTIAKYAHNAKFDVEVLLQLGITVAPLQFDTMLAASLLDKRRSLKELAFYELMLPEPPPSIETLIGKGKQQISIDQADITAVTNYAASDADYTWQLASKLIPAIAEQVHTAQLLYELEMPLIAVLVRMEQAGIRVDRTYLEALSQRVSGQIQQLESEIYAIAGTHPVNLRETDSAMSSSAPCNSPRRDSKKPKRGVGR